MNENSPLIQALKGRAKPKPETSFDQFEPPRSFEIKHEEIPGLPGRKVGEKLSVRLEGHIHSQHNDGRSVMHVASVKPDTDAMTAKEHPDLKTPSKSGAVVTTQESHVP
jgi:hypothetical protein